MAIHYFHCTDGIDLIVDRSGREITGPRELACSAKAAAEAVMRAVPSYDAWEAWAVYVYNERGQVAIVPFLPGLEEGAALTGALTREAKARYGFSGGAAACEADAALVAPAG